MLAISVIAALIGIWGSLALRRRLQRVLVDLRRARNARSEEERRHDEDLRAASRLIQRIKQEQLTLDMAKERFLEVVSHELRTPLTAMVAAVEILDHETVSGGPLNEWVDVVRMSTNRLRHIVERIEEMVKLEATLERGQFRIASLDTVIEEVKTRLPALVGERGIQVVFDSRLHDVGVSGSEAHLVRLLELLIENAVQFSPPDTKVVVRCEPLLHRTDDRLHVQVLDRGPGIPEEDLPRIFESFHQVRTHSNGKPDGLGLGLSICRSLAASFGTEISVRRRSEGGTAFHVDLPCYFRSRAERAEAAVV